MFKRTLIAAAVLASSSANAYLFEANYEFRMTDFDVSINGVDQDDNLQFTHNTVSASVFIEDVDISKGAWNQAAFLNQSSYVEGGYIGQKTEFGDDGSDIDGFNMGGRGVIDGFIIDGEFQQLKDDDGESARTLELGFGGYIGEYHSLVGAFVNTDSESLKYNLLGLEYQGYIPLGSSGHSLALEAEWRSGFGEDQTDNQDYRVSIFNAQLGYSPLPQLTVGGRLGASKETYEESKVGNVTLLGTDITRSQLGLFANYYIVEQFRIGAEFGLDKIEAESGPFKSDYDGAYYGVDLSVRF